MTSTNEMPISKTKSVKQNRLKILDPASLKTLIDQQAVALIDVREPAEHAGEKIPGSILVPLSSFDPTKVPTRSGQPTVLYCRTGNRSAQAAQKLFASGVSEVTHLEGGLSAWVKMGYPTQVNKTAPISLMRQVQIAAGSLVVIGTVLGAFVSPWFLILSGFVGSGLVFAGISDTCALGMLIAKMPWNQRV
ncbi:rhodanese-like domain-containing protein [Leptolyngbya sp. CCNP1308]|uniref:rhodanese-like domain-containing protein n=1 Tax=Leptolyngbya sp. CCNP1308 TaxID=3110255 RepID=UPI002B20600B|nr:rhodanese-like domain-containing protein [Leptolyngbya sp. CCNP1308]MEA5452804.1 rhodanese-like domain-containing protein [Leptolyngbya sp. CCNP1308]